MWPILINPLRIITDTKILGLGFCCYDNVIYSIHGSIPRVHYVQLESGLLHLIIET
jgi:hypothetical protein